MIRSLLLSLLALLAGPAFAQAPGPPAGAQGSAPAAAADRDEDEKVVCRSVFLVGSRIPERVCRTTTEWARLEQESREALSRNRRNAGAPGDTL